VAVAGGARKYSEELTFKLHPALHVSALLGYIQEAFLHYKRKLHGCFTAFVDLRISFYNVGLVLKKNKLGRSAYGNMMFQINTVCYTKTKKKKLWP
jgi:hypothetical protein